MPRGGDVTIANVLLTFSVLGLFIFRRRNKIVITVKNVLENTRGASILERFIEVTCQCWAFHAQFWHGYQVHGEQTIVDLNKRKKVRKNLKKMTKSWLGMSYCLLSWCPPSRLLLFYHLVSNKVSNSDPIGCRSLHVQCSWFWDHAKCNGSYYWPKIQNRRLAQKRKRCNCFAWWCSRGTLLEKLWNYLGM